MVYWGLGIGGPLCSLGRAPMLGLRGVCWRVLVLLGSLLVVAMVCWLSLQVGGVVVDVVDVVLILLILIVVDV